MIEDADAAGKIPLWIQDGLLRIVGGQISVGFPVESATISLAVLIAELQQSFLVSDSASHVIEHSDFRLSMAHVRGGIEAGLGGSHGLKQVGPPGAFVLFLHGVEGRTVAANIARHPRR